MCIDIQSLITFSLFCFLLDIARITDIASICTLYFVEKKKRRRTRRTLFRADAMLEIWNLFLSRSDSTKWTELFCSRRNSRIPSLHCRYREKCSPRSCLLTIVAILRTLQPTKGEGRSHKAPRTEHGRGRKGTNNQKYCLLMCHVLCLHGLN